MTPKAEEFLLKFTRELCRTLFETMADVAAAKVVLRTQLPNGKAVWDEVAAETHAATKPILDQIEHLSDQELLDTLVKLKLPSQ